MKRCVLGLAVVGLAQAGCGSDEPEDGTTTENASTVGMTSGASAGEVSSTSSGGGSGESEGSGSEGSGSGGASIDYEGEIQPIFNGSCTCHLMGDSGEMAAPFLTLNPGMSHADLVGVMSEQAPLNRIEPGSPDDSYLYLKVTGNHLPVGSGNPMPQIGVLGDAQVQLIESWILAGAPE